MIERQSDVTPGALSAGGRPNNGTQPVRQHIYAAVVWAEA